ncbi:MAG: VCBS repeat-containing protein, partial [bacterium]|nr:VCBS repeat-containing protein [bacterium]
CDTSDSAGSTLSCVHPVFLPGETIQYMIPADGLGVNGLPGNNPHLEGIFVGATSEAAGTFSAPVVAAQGVNHEDVIAADFDGDGNLDLALSDPDNDQISILINQGDNTFAEVVNYDVGDTPTRLVVGDFNTVEAGYPDIVVINSAGNTVSVLLNNGVNDPGTFEDAVGSPFAVGDNPSALFVADFYLDNPESELDGNLDIVVVSRDGGAAGASSLTVLDGDGAGNFDAGVGIVDQTPIQDLSSFVYTDLDDDGDFDEIAADGSSAFGGSQLFISERDDPDETESVGVPLTLDANPNANVRVVSPVHDLDGDGNLDIVGLVPSLNLLRVFPGSGDVDGYTDVPTNITNICSDGIPSSVAQGDVDGGGELDIVVACAGATNEVIVLIHDDAFSYSSSSVSLSSSPNELILADMDGDGRLDLVVAMDSTVAIAYGEAPAVSTSSGRSAGLRRTHISDVRDSEEPPVEEGSTRHDAADGESGEPEGIIGVGGDGGGNSSDPLSEMEILEQFVGSATVEEIQQGSSLVEVPIVLIRRALSALRAMVLGDSWPQLDAYMAAGIEFSITKPELLSMLIQRLPDHEALLQRGYDLHVSSKGNSPIPDVTVLLKTVTAILAEIPSLPFGEMLERTSTCERQFPDRWYSCILREYHRDTPIKTSLEYAIQPPTAELLREVLNAVMGRL